MLVAPRQHVVTLADLPAAAVGPFFLRVQRISAVMPAALRSQGTFVAANNVVSQSVPHLHVHVVPRTKGDGLRGFFWPRQRYEVDTEAADYAARPALGAAAEAAAASSGEHGHQQAGRHGDLGDGAEDIAGDAAEAADRERGQRQRHQQPGRDLEPRRASRRTRR